LNLLGNPRPTQGNNLIPFSCAGKVRLICFKPLGLFWLLITFRKNCFVFLTSAITYNKIPNRYDFRIPPGLLPGASSRDRGYAIQPNYAMLPYRREDLCVSGYRGL